jgi:hypothetical protein
MSSASDILARISYVRDRALVDPQRPIEMDRSGVGEVTTEYPPAEAAVVEGTDPASFTGTTATFDLQPNAPTRVAFDKSFITITGYAANMTIGSGSPVLLGASIPWNTIAAVLRSARIQLNNQSDNVENIQNNLGHGSMVKMLTTYTRSQLEAMDDQLFTPCIESNRDFNTGVFGIASTLSQESQDRRLQQLLRTTGPLDVAPLQRVVSKNIYLCDLFDSLKLPANWLTKNLHIELTFKRANEILIKDTGCLGVNAANQKFFITSVLLNLTASSLSAEEIGKSEDMLRSNPNEVLVQQSFISYDTIQKTHSNGANHRDSNVRNMQASVVLFPSDKTPDLTGANPYQYAYDSDALFASPVTGYQMRYDNVYSPSRNLRVNASPTQVGANSQLYAQYRLLCARMTDRENDLALSLKHFSPAFRGTEDYSPYVLFCSPFYSMTAAGHPLHGGSDHEVIIGGGTASTIIICRIRLSLVDLLVSGQMHVVL